MNKYEVLSNIGEGAYGVVLQCRNKETGELVAIKRFKESDEDELVRKTTLREVKILRLLKEETHVVHLLEAFRRKGKLYLVFEYVGCNLLDVLEKHPQGLDMEEVKRMIFTLLLGVRACHINSVIHRDIKPENLLMHPDSTMRLCDFGFARIYNTSMDDLTDYVATRWYRSPELLLGTTNYGLPSDMWAVGCIMAEMVDGQALFPGESELDQIFMIQKLLGNFTPQQVDVFRKNKRFAGETLRDVSKTESTLDRKYGRKANKPALHFLKSLLVIDPEKRLTVDEAIHHPFFEGMIEQYAPHLKLAIPLIRPSTASKFQQQQQPIQVQHVMADQPPRPMSTTAEQAQPQQSSSTTPVVMAMNVPPSHVQQVSRLSQASSTGSITGNFTSMPQQQAPMGTAQQQQRGSSFLPTRIGSGSRRPPSQQQQRVQEDPSPPHNFAYAQPPQPSNVAVYGGNPTYGNNPVYGQQVYGSPAYGNPPMQQPQQTYVMQQSQQPSTINRANVQQPAQYQMQPLAQAPLSGANYLANARSNLPRLAPYQAPPVATTQVQFAPRFSGGFVNGATTLPSRTTPRGKQQAATRRSLATLQQTSTAHHHRSNHGGMCTRFGGDYVQYSYYFRYFLALLVLSQ